MIHLVPSDIGLDMNTKVEVVFIVMVLLNLTMIQICVNLPRLL